MSVYRVPQEFQARLEEEFGPDKIRLRWSHEWDEWHVEQKVRRGLVGLGEGRKERYQDDVIRYRDGYMWVMSVKQGSRFSCPKCHLPLTAPTRETKMVSCTHCRLKGYDHQWPACHWPMDETLIEHLKLLERGIDTKHKEMQAARVMLEKQKLRQVLDPTVDAFRDNFELGMGIQSVGYTGREKMWHG